MSNLPSSGAWLTQPRCWACNTVAPSGPVKDPAIQSLPGDQQGRSRRTGRLDPEGSGRTAFEATGAAPRKDVRALLDLEVTLQRYDGTSLSPVGPSDLAFPLQSRGRKPRVKPSCDSNREAWAGGWNLGAWPVLCPRVLSRRRLGDGEKSNGSRLDPPEAWGCCIKVRGASSRLLRRLQAQTALVDAGVKARDSGRGGPAGALRLFGVERVEATPGHRRS
ncbi:hypothetical protein NDU88_005742 [Pleurodeles waltl]|uniref:Uncharacterized protein n=1 Tax=Pleurodeles waltl TaxID=8319 RepID=A0AAV7MXC2_PLEWA|nr:hypothetical protein NDU88_005742 [Pleurodeles waltl]